VMVTIWMSSGRKQRINKLSR